MQEFEHMDSTSGTLVIIYNMKLLDSGEPELDHKTNRFDILLSNPEGRDFDTDEGSVNCKILLGNLQIASTCNADL